MNRAMSWLLKTIGIEAKVLCQTRQRSQMVKLAELFLETAGNPAPNVETSFLSQLSRAAHSSRAATINQKPNQHRLLTILESLDFTEEVLRQPQYEVNFLSFIGVGGPENGNFLLGVVHKLRLQNLSFF
jgi:hypothetical protein